MSSIGNSIDEDLLTAEHEVSDVSAPLIGSGTSELMEFCRVIKVDIEQKYREASEKVVRMHFGRTTNTSRVMEDDIVTYLRRLRQVMSDLRRARCTTPSSDIHSSPAPTGVSVASGYKKYIERI